MNAGDLSAEVVVSNLTKVYDKNAGNITDRWILTKLDMAIRNVTKQMDHFEFGIAGQILYNFIWDDFANWYIELTKEVLYGNDEAEKEVTRSVLLHVLDTILRLLHPIMPFFTEAIFEKMPNTTGSIVIASWPKANEKIGLNFTDLRYGVEGLLIGVITAVRNIRAELNVPLSKKVLILIKTDEVDFLNSVKPYIVRFTNPSKLEIAKNLGVPEQAVSAVITGAEIYLPLAGLINIREEITRLIKELEKWNSEIALVNKKLDNEKFVTNAKPELVKKERQKLADYQEKFASTQARIAELKSSE